MVGMEIGSVASASPLAWCSTTANSLWCSATRHNRAVRTLDRLLLRGLRSRIPSGATVLAVERGTSDALGETRKTRAVLTDDALFLATPVRSRTILTVVPRSDIQSVDVLEPRVVAITFEDYGRATRRVVRLNLSKHGDRGGIVTQLTK